MKDKRIGIVSLVIFLSACAPVASEPPVATPPSTAAAILPTATPAVVALCLPTPVPGTVALDFAAKPCSASWSNNGEYLPCPGDLNTVSGGYADRFDAVIINGGIQIEAQGLLTIPAQLDSPFYAIFGKYPPFSIIAGDRFQAVLACADSHPDCDVNFSLEYYAPNGQLIQIPTAKWDVQAAPEGNYIYADADLSFLAGQTVQFSLSVHDNGSAADDYAVWIMPHIAREGGAASDAAPPQQLSPAVVETVTVSGSVDMQSAPPYLYDDHPPGTPAAVVFFEVGGEKWYTVSTELTHPYFSMDVLPGDYYVLAFAHGVGETPFVSGAFTGVDPSCGNAMAVLNVLPGKPISGLHINDWNWSCDGTAGRMEKPEEIALP